VSWLILVEVAGSVVLTLLTLGGYLRWLNNQSRKEALADNNLLDAKLKLLIKENKTNGGSSMKDALNRIEHDLSYVNVKLDTHIDWHMKGGKGV